MLSVAAPATAPHAQNCVCSGLKREFVWLSLSSLSLSHLLWLSFCHFVSWLSTSIFMFHDPTKTNNGQHGIFCHNTSIYVLLLLLLVLLLSFAIRLCTQNICHAKWLMLAGALPAGYIIHTIYFIYRLDIMSNITSKMRCSKRHFQVSEWYCHSYVAANRLIIAIPRWLDEMWKAKF